MHLATDPFQSAPLHHPWADLWTMMIRQITMKSSLYSRRVALKSMTLHSALQKDDSVSEPLQPSRLPPQSPTCN